MGQFLHHQMKRVTTSLRRLLLLRQLRILRQELGRIELKALFFLAYTDKGNRGEEVDSVKSLLPTMKGPQPRQKKKELLRERLCLVARIALP